MKRIVSFMLAVILVFSVTSISIPASAAVVSGKYTSGAFPAMGRSSINSTIVPEENMVQEVREHLTNRDTEFSVDVYIGQEHLENLNNYVSEYSNVLIDAAQEHNGIANQGDYIRYQIRTISWAPLKTSVQKPEKAV